VNRTRYMATFEELVTAALPALAGRIEWDSAVYFYNTGLTVTDAASRYVKTRTPREVHSNPASFD